MGGHGEDGDEYETHAPGNPSQQPPQQQQLAAQQQQQAQDAKERGGKNSSCHWTPEEDKILLNHVMRYGSRYWGLLQATGQLPQRDQKSCCNRFLLLKKRCLGTTSAVVVHASHAAAVSQSAPSQPAAAAASPQAQAQAQAPTAPSSPASQAAPAASPPPASSPSLTAPPAAGTPATVRSAALPIATRVQPSAPASSPAAAPRVGASAPFPAHLASPAAGAPSVPAGSPSLSPSPSTMPLPHAQPLGRSPFAQPVTSPTAPIDEQHASLGGAPLRRDISTSGAPPASPAASGGAGAGMAQVRVKTEQEHSEVAEGVTGDAAASIDGASGGLARSSVACGAGVKEERSDAGAESAGPVAACSAEGGACVGGGGAAAAAGATAGAVPACAGGASTGAASGSAGGGRVAALILPNVTPDLMSAAASGAAVPLPSVVATPSERKRNNKVVACRIALLLQQAPPRTPPSASAAGASDSSAVTLAANSALPLADSAPTPIRASTAAAGGPSADPSAACASSGAAGSAAPVAPSAPSATAPNPAQPGGSGGPASAPRPLGSAAPAFGPAFGAVAEAGQGMKAEGADMGTGSSARYYHPAAPGQCGQQQQQSPAFHHYQPSQQPPRSLPNIVVNEGCTSDTGRAGRALAEACLGAAGMGGATPAEDTEARGTAVTDARTPAPGLPLSPALPAAPPVHLARCHSEPCVSAAPHAAPLAISAAPFLPQQHSAHVSPPAGTYAAAHGPASAENSTPPSAQPISPCNHPPATPTFLPSSCPSANRALSPLLLSAAAVPLDDPAPVFSCAMHPPAFTGAHPLPPPLPHCAEQVPAGQPLGRRPRRLAFGGSPSTIPAGCFADPPAAGAPGIDAYVIAGVAAAGGGAAIARRKRQACSSSGGSSSVGRGEGRNDGGSNSCSSRREGAGRDTGTADCAGDVGGAMGEAEEEQGRADGGEALGDVGRSGSSSDQCGGVGEEGEWERGERGDVKRHAGETRSRPGSPAHAPRAALPAGPTPPGDSALTASAPAGAHMGVVGPMAHRAPASPALAASVTCSPGSSGSAFSPGVHRTRYGRGHEVGRRVSAAQMSRMADAGAHEQQQQQQQQYPCTHATQHGPHCRAAPLLSPVHPPLSPAAAAAAAAATGPMSPNPVLGASISAPVTPTAATCHVGGQQPHAALHKSTSAHSFLAGMRCLLPLGPTTSHRWLGPVTAAPAAAAGGAEAVGAATAAGEDMGAFSLPSPHHPLASGCLRPRAAPPPPLFLSASSSASSMQALVDEAFPSGLRPALLLAAAAAPTAAPSAAAAADGEACVAAAAVADGGCASAGGADGAGGGANAWLGVEAASCEVMSVDDEEAEQERMAARALLRVLELWPHAMQTDEDEEDGEEGERTSATATTTNTPPATATAAAPGAGVSSPLSRPIPPAFSNLLPAAGASSAPVPATAPATSLPQPHGEMKQGEAAGALKCASPAARGVAAGEACEVSVARVQGKGRAAVAGVGGEGSNSAVGKARGSAEREEQEGGVGDASSVKGEDSVGVDGGVDRDELPGQREEDREEGETVGTDCELGRGKGGGSGVEQKEQLQKQENLQQQQQQQQGQQQRNQTGQKRPSTASPDMPTTKRLAMFGRTCEGHPAAVASSIAAPCAPAAVTGGAVQAAGDGGGARAACGWVMGEDDSEEDTRGARKEAGAVGCPRPSPSPSAGHALPIAVPIHHHHHAHTPPAPAAPTASATAATTTATAGTGGAAATGACSKPISPGEVAAEAARERKERGRCGSSSSSSSSGAETESGVSESLMEYLQTVDDLPGAAVLQLDKHSDSESDADRQPEHQGRGDGDGRGAVQGWQGLGSGGGGRQSAESVAAPAAVVTGGAAGGVHVSGGGKQPAAGVDVAGRRDMGLCSAAAAPRGAAAAAGGGVVGAVVERSRVRAGMGGCCLDMDAPVTAVGVAGGCTRSVSACTSNVGF
ncbi:hypothetical protein CLOM_g13019 [Closterium sp. NIES-68]|nr:hypothetical protein CLOM_g13019 [Closterium sp. NIES-68]GJP84092.1 hypothetical protein CLOP_g14179 [Closterium sp. NIES-67]